MNKEIMNEVSVIFKQYLPLKNTIQYNTYEKRRELIIKLLDGTQLKSLLEQAQKDVQERILKIAINSNSLNDFMMSMMTQR